MSKYTDLAAKLHGATHARGGATYHFGGAVPLIHYEGYVVGGAVGLSIVIPASAGPEAYEKALTALAFTATEPIAFVGTWINGDHVYVDAVNHYRFLDDAVKVGRERGEMAVWDVGMSEEVTL